MNVGRTPLVILPLDAADEEWVLQWIEEGHLPALRGIIERGCHGRTSGPELVVEHGSWVSLFSGVSRAVHHYYSFRQLSPGTYDLVPTRADRAIAKPFWYRLPAGVKAAVIDPPDHGLTAELDGIQLMNWATHQPSIGTLEPDARPTELLAEARRVFGPPMPLSEFDPAATPQSDEETFARYLDRVRRKGGLIRHLLEKDQFQLIVAGFHEAHTGAHRFWEDSTDDGKRTSPRRILEIYRAIDHELGLILEKVGDRANVIVLSAFGMKHLYPTTDLIESFCRQMGYQATPVAARPERTRSPVSIARSLLPQWLRLAISKRLPQHAQEKLLASAFRDSTDWSRTRAFAIPTLYLAFLRVNLRGREPQGIVEPGQEYLDLLAELEQELMRIVDPRTGSPAVEKISRAVDLFSGGPPEQLPDLIVEFNPTSYFHERLVHPRCELTQTPPIYFRGSEHSHSGFLAAAGPGITGRGAVGDLPVENFARTFFELLECAPPVGLKGNVLTQITG